MNRSRKELPLLSDSPVFLLGSHKSGTSLLRALLDGHEQLEVLPRETHFFALMGYWIDYGLKRQWPCPETGNLRDRFVGHVRDRAADLELRVATGPFSDAPDFAGYNADAFERAFNPPADSSPRRLFEMFMGALHLAHTGQELAPGARVVEKSVENAEFVDHIRDMFPAAKFVHIVRNPYAALVAIRRARSQEGRYPAMQPVIDSLTNSAYFLYRNRKRHADGSYLVIRYEDLLRDPSTAMQLVVDHLGIDYADSLLHPTAGGRTWEGNSTSRSSQGGFTGISTAPIDAWRAHISGFEIALVNHWLGPVFDGFGYERLQSPARRHGLRRLVGRDGLPRESLTTFLQNRALLGMVRPGAR